MQKTTRYAIFKTKWGYFGLAAADNGLLRSCLPLAEREKVELQLLQNLSDPQYPVRDALRHDKDLFKTAQEQITAYFEGACINFRAIPVVLDGLGLFTRRVLTTCRDIKFGQTVSYGRLAEMAGKSGAARAVGGVLAKNPLPLIIPCHRVICANGKIGGFSTMGAVKLKKRMLELEASNIA